MAGYGEPPYFDEARAAGRIIVRGILTQAHLVVYLCSGLTAGIDPPKFDLDTYIANYKGVHSEETGLLHTAGQF